MDPAAAAWIVEAAAPWQQVVTFGPPGFEAYARLRYIPDPGAPVQAEADAGRPGGLLSDGEQAARALRLLAGSGPPDEYRTALWEGYPHLVFPPGTPLVDLVHRRYALVRGIVADHEVPPAFVWPVDRSWCFASDVDPHWAGIGASRSAIDALLGDPELDVVPARPDEPQPWYR